jgi:hypothetical protein
MPGRHAWPDGKKVKIVHPRAGPVRCLQVPCVDRARSDQPRVWGCLLNVPLCPVINPKTRNIAWSMGSRRPWELNVTTAHSTDDWMALRQDAF